MRVLVACEFSGRVRDAFIARGHDAVSCDLLDTEVPGPHIKGDILEVLNQGWDLMIAFPPCTDIAVSGARWFPEKIADGRQQRAIEFFLALANAPIPKICIENPIGIMGKHYRKHDQIVQPYMFGDAFEKKTCLWLKGLPLLQPTQIVEPPPRKVFDSGKTMPQWYNDAFNGPKSERAKTRSRTFPGLANAMASQWSTTANK